MKKLFIRICMLLFAVSLLPLSACVELRNTTGYVETTETGIPTPIAAESASGTETVSDTDTTLSETVSSGTENDETIRFETRAPETEMAETSTAAVEKPETDAPIVAAEESMQETTAPPAATAVNVDVDLTALSSTMVYAEVFNMMMNPNDYIGKTIKMHGSFAIGYSNNADGTMNTESIVFACVIADATACCSQGIEFVLSGEHTYPDDYPALSSEITVVGTFTTYEEYGMLYCTLTDAVMEG